MLGGFKEKMYRSYFVEGPAPRRSSTNDGGGDPGGPVGLFSVVLVVVIAVILLLIPGGMSRYFKEIKTKNGGPDCSCDLPEIPWQIGKTEI